MQHRLITLASLVLILTLTSLSYGQNTEKAVRQDDTVDQNKQLILRLFGEVFNQQSFSVIDQLYHVNMVDHSAFPDQAPGVEGIRSAIKGFFEIFDDIKISVEDIIAEGDKVVTREVWQVTHKQSGKTIEGSVIHIFRVRDGRISDEWSRGWDWLNNI